MAQLEFNEPVKTRAPALEIDGLKAGTYRFQLRVFDDTGNVSLPDIVSVKVAYRVIDPSRASEHFPGNYP
jgi:long-subunit fatty acid transport protein